MALIPTSTANIERQYVGARYVPQFADPIEWQNNVAYEQLTIVTYLGASYTSKIPVPAGVEPTNKEYWALTGNYNAQVSEYQKLVLEYKGEVDTLKPQVTVNTANIEKNSTEIIKNTSDIEKLKNRPAFGAIRSANILLFGDSLNVGNGWGMSFSQAVGSGKVFSVGNGSMGFVSAGNTAPYAGMTAIQTLTAYLASWTSKEKNELNYFVVGLGINDHSASSSAVKTAVSDFFKYAKEQFPNAQIYFFLDHTFKQTNNSLRTIYNAILETANSLGVATTTDLWMACLDHMGTWPQTDMVHMTTIGYTEYGQAILNWVCGGTVLKPVYFSLTPAEGFTIFNNQTVCYAYCGRVYINLVLRTAGQLEWVSNSYSGNGFTSPYLLKNKGYYGWDRALSFINTNLIRASALEAIIAETGDIKLAKSADYTPPDIMQFFVTLDYSQI